VQLKKFLCFYNNVSRV